MCDQILVDCSREFWRLSLSNLNSADMNAANAEADSNASIASVVASVNGWIHGSQVHRVTATPAGSSPGSESGVGPAARFDDCSSLGFGMLVSLETVGRIVIATFGQAEVNRGQMGCSSKLTEPVLESTTTEPKGNWWAANVSVWTSVGFVTSRA